MCNRGVPNIDHQIETGDVNPLYVNTKIASVFYRGSGLNYSAHSDSLRGYSSNLKTDRDLVKYRSENEVNFSRNEKLPQSAFGKSKDGNTWIREIPQDLMAQFSKGISKTMDFHLLMNRLQKISIVVWLDNFDDSWKEAYVTTDLLPSLREFAKATEAAFGSTITAIKPTDRRLNIFNGINYGGTNYININSDVEFINTVGHELYHDLKKQRPDLHA